LTIYEKKSEDIFVSTDLIRLKYQLLPLLAMKVVVDEILLEKPDIRVERFKDGSFNFSDLTGEDGKANETPTQPSGSEGTPISLLVSNVNVSGGQLTFLDHTLNNKSPYRYQLSALDITASGVSLTGKVPVKVHCQLNGTPVDINGHVSLVPLGGDFDINLQGLDVVAFKPYLTGVLPGKLGGLKLGLKTNVTGSKDDLSLKGTLQLSELDFVPDALPEAALENASIDVDYNLQFKQADELLHLDQLDVDYNGIKVKTSGDVQSVMTEPSLKLDVTVPELQVRQALRAVPVALTGDLGSFDPAGSLSMEANLSGPVKNAVALLKSATVRMDNIQATAGGYRPALTGTLKLVGDQLNSEGLFVRMGDNRADISLAAKQLFEKTIVVKADVSSDRFDLDPLMKGSAGSAVATDQASSDRSGKTGTQELGPFDIPLYATGSIKVAEALWKGMSIKNFLARYELKNNVLDLTSIDGQVAGGSFSNSARIDLGVKGLSYSASLGLKTIQADPLLTALSPKAAGSLIGALNLDMNIQGRGTQWETLSKKLNGQGDMLVADGRVVSPELVQGFASFLQLPNTNEIAFSNFKGSVRIADGKLKLDSSISSDQIKLYPKGDIGLDGLLNLSLDTRLSPQLSNRLDAKGKVAQYLKDNEGWSQVPLLVSGNYSSPRFGLDPKGLKSQAKKALTDELGKQINKLIGGSSSQQSGTGSTEDQKTSPDPASQLLQKLFGN